MNILSGLAMEGSTGNLGTMLCSRCLPFTVPAGHMGIQEGCANADGGVSGTK